MLPESFLAANEFVLVIHTPKCQDLYINYLGANPVRRRSLSVMYCTCVLLSLKYIAKEV